MAGISDKDKAVMTAKAGGPATFTSLAESLQDQLNKANIAQESFESFQPQAQKSAEAIGSFEGRAPGESPVDIRAQGLTTAQAISQTAGRTQGNILDVITSMMNLKKDERAAKQADIDRELSIQKLNEEGASNGMIWDETKQTMRGMTEAEKNTHSETKFSTLSDGDAISAITDELGTGVWLGRTTKERGARARALLGKLDRGEPLELNEWLAQDDANIVTTLRELQKAWALGPGTEDDLSVGPFKGFFRTLAGKARLDPDVEFYNSQKDALTAALKEITGDTGVLTDSDAKRIIGLLPSLTSSPEKAAKDWQALENKLQATLGVSLFEGEEGGVTTDTGLSQEDEDLINKYKGN